MKYLVLFLALFLIVSCDESNSDDNDCNCADNQICNADNVCVDKVECDCTENQYCNADKVCVDKAVCEDNQFSTNSGTCVDKICADAASCKTGTLGEDCYANADTCDAGLLCIDGKCSDELKVVSEDEKYQLQSHSVMLSDASQIDELFTLQDFEYDEDNTSSTYGTVLKYGTILIKYSELAEKISVGNVLQFTLSTLTPRGLLVKITSLNYTDQGVVFEVEEATLLDFYKRLLVDKRIPVTTDEGTGGDAFGGGDDQDIEDAMKNAKISMQKPYSAKFPIGYNTVTGKADSFLTFDATSVEVEAKTWCPGVKKDKDHSQDCSIKTKLSPTIKPGLDARIDIEWFEEGSIAVLHELKFIPELEAGLTGEVTATAAYKKEWKAGYGSGEIGKLRTPQFTVAAGLLGPVPIMLGAHLGVDFAIEVSGEITLKSSATYKITTGVHYKRMGTCERVESGNANKACHSGKGHNCCESNSDCDGWTNECEYSLKDSYKNVFDDSLTSSSEATGKIELKGSAAPFFELQFLVCNVANFFSIKAGAKLTLGGKLEASASTTNGLKKLMARVYAELEFFGTIFADLKLVWKGNEYEIINFTDFNSWGANIQPLKFGLCKEGGNFCEKDSDCSGFDDKCQGIKISFNDGINIEQMLPWTLYEREWGTIPCTKNNDSECGALGGNSDIEVWKSSDPKVAFCNKETSKKDESAECVKSECGKCTKVMGYVDANHKAIYTTCNTSTKKCTGILSKLDCSADYECADFQYVEECKSGECALKSGRCLKDSDCKIDDSQDEDGTKFCNYYGKCVDVCTYKKPCGDNPPENSACVADNHKGYCACGDGFEGNPGEENGACHAECAKVGDEDKAPAPMCDIVGSEYPMGCVPGDIYCDCDSDTATDVCTESGNEKPVHNMTVSSFKLDQYEVTVADYKKCVTAGDCNAADHVLNADPNFCNYYNEDSDKKPMNCITWEGARDFCVWNGKRLPTETEWEYAAKGGTKNNIYPFVTLPEEDEAVCSVAVHSSSQNKCNPGGTKNVGLFGKDVSVIGADGSIARIHDMAGNVSEWVKDRYSDESYGQSWPEGPTEGCSTEQLIKDGECEYLQHIYRGGNFNSTEIKVLRSTYRKKEDMQSAEFRDEDSGELVHYMPGVGFRCAQ